MSLDVSRIYTRVAVRRTTEPPPAIWGPLEVTRIYVRVALSNRAPVAPTSATKVWDGSQWHPATQGRVWDGSGWVPLTAGKVWNGSEWVPV